MKEDADEQMLEIENWVVHPNFGKGEFWDVGTESMRKTLNFLKDANKLCVCVCVCVCVGGGEGGLTVVRKLS
ncbi:hypothetical protein E2C01_095583 [Portunus trituberculatus]|uniref:Uncharacterized protein n=1 Tax=Portunus trituberculatus TaxID=210409 RepID=A0A5B7JZ82_PORTR|nr:hypothetical protein [Portunus trituberculatus]